MKYIVYQTTNIKNNKIYIGVHKCENPEVFNGYIGCGIRITVPSSYMNPTTPLQFAVKKYGTKCFNRIVLKVFDNPIDAYKLESELVNKEFINRKDTYNAKLGGFGGSSYSIKINQFSLTGEYLKTWDSLVDAADFYSVSDTAIANAWKYKGSCKDYFWSEEFEINHKEYTHFVGQTCYKYSESGKFICMYNSLVEAAKDNDVYLQSIQRSVKGGYKVGEFFYSTELHEVYSGQPKISLKNKSIYIYDLKGNYITTLNNGKMICDFFKIKSTSSITTAMRTGRQYKEYQISLEKKDKLDEIVDKRNIKKKVGQYSLTGDFIRMFDSITQASTEFGSGVSKVVKGQQKQCKGFIFKYE